MTVKNIVEEKSKEWQSRQSLSIYITRPLQSSSPISEKKIDKEPLDKIATLHRVERSSHSDSTSINDLLEAVETIHPLLDVHVYPLEHRPDLAKVLEHLIDKRTSLYCCGPAGLLDTARNVSRRHNLDYHEEAFAW